jgi:hypothetical protein
MFLSVFPFSPAIALDDKAGSKRLLPRFADVISDAVKGKG